MSETVKTFPTEVLTEVFSTASGAVFQSDREKCWYIRFESNTARFEYRCLQKLKKAVAAINIERLLLNDGKEDDLEIIVCSCGPVYILSIRQILALRELLQGAFVMLELNAMTYDCLNRLPA